jgi:RNA 3'-terminal phosphate cyclase (ATP)
MLTIDGAQGEGGGQILRTALALSVCLQRPFCIRNIRANRSRPGLQFQHLAAVNAAAAISGAAVTGADRDSLSLAFRPRAVAPGAYRFDIGTAGSTSLVLQTILPALVLAPGDSTIVLAGGTHNPLAPPFEFLESAFVPLINRMGAGVNVTLQNRGFAPAGGGQIHASISPTRRLQPLDLLQRGAIIRCHAEVLLANLPAHIAERELAVIAGQLSLPASDQHVTVDSSAPGAGNVASIMIESAHITECFSAFGKKGLPAERVAELAVRPAQRYLAAGVPVGEHLADQLLVWIALAGRGSFVTLKPSLHTLTNIDVIESFAGLSFDVRQLGHDAWQISLT